MPDDDDIERMRTYMVERMSALLLDPYKHWSTHDFVELRDLADCQLTMFYARWGDEPARLIMSNWEDAKSDSWLHRDRLSHMTETERLFFSKMKVMYQSEKGNHLVLFLVPADTMAVSRPATNSIKRWTPTRAVLVTASHCRPSERTLTIGT